MLLQQVAGQQRTKEKLTFLATANRLSHALLFSGNKGSGALPMAMAFVQYLMCKQNTVYNEAATTNTNSLFGEEFPQTTSSNHTTNDEPMSDACGVCDNCLKINQLIHPDVHFSYPVVPKKSGDKPVSTDYIAEWRNFIKQTNGYADAYNWLQFIDAENKQGNITAAECTDIIKKLNLKSFSGGYKVLIMWLPEYLGKEGNRLLKLLEEPPEQTLFILVTENEQALLPTILSRLQVIRMQPLSVANIGAALEQQYNIDAEQAKQIAFIAHGNYYEAMQLASQNQAGSEHADNDEFLWDESLKQWMNAILRTGPADQVKWIEQISKLGREKQKQFLQFFINHINDAVKATYFKDWEAGAFAHRLAHIADINQLHDMLAELDKAIYYIERNANSKLLFHALTIKLYEIFRNKSLILVK